MAGWLLNYHFEDMADREEADSLLGRHVAACHNGDLLAALCQETVGDHSYHTPDAQWAEEAQWNAHCRSALAKGLWGSTEPRSADAEASIAFDVRKIAGHLLPRSAGSSTPAPPNARSSTSAAGQGSARRESEHLDSTVTHLKRAGKLLAPQYHHDRELAAI